MLVNWSWCVRKARKKFFLYLKSSENWKEMLLRLRRTCEFFFLILPWEHIVNLGAFWKREPNFASREHLLRDFRIHGTSLTNLCLIVHWSTQKSENILINYGVYPVAQFHPPLKYSIEVESSFHCKFLCWIFYYAKQPLLDVTFLVYLSTIRGHISELPDQMCEGSKSVWSHEPFLLVFVSLKFRTKNVSEEEKYFSWQREREMGWDANISIPRFQLYQILHSKAF